MSNFMNNVFNPPASLQSGQIWHCNALNRNLLITEVDESYNSIGIVRAMVIKNSNILADENEVSIELDELLGLALGKVNVTLRITDGPVCKEDLSFYCGDIPDKYISKVSQAVKKIPSYTEEQMFVINDILDELQPLRERAMKKTDEAAEKFADTLQVISILDRLTESLPEYVHDYSMVAADGSNQAGEEAFWKKEFDSNPVEIESGIVDTKIYLCVIDGGMYFVCYSKKLSSMGNIKLFNGSFEIPVGKGFVSFGSKRRIFAYVPDSNLLGEGIWELQFEADGENFRIPFSLT